MKLENSQDFASVIFPSKDWLPVRCSVHLTSFQFHAMEVTIDLLMHPLMQQQQVCLLLSEQSPECHPD